MPSVPAGYRLTEKQRTGSTNADCLEAARAGETGGLWIRAVSQTSGRGSRGRDWVSEPGNLFTSLLLDVPPVVEKLSTLTFAASLAVADTVEVLGVEWAVRLGGRPEVTLKWPNDVLAGGSKLAGILLESHRIEDRAIVIAGIGVNCISHPPQANYPATSLRAEGIEADAEQVMEILADQLANRLLQWDWGRGFASIRDDWLAQAAGVGEQIEIRIGGEIRHGVFETMDENGLLIMRDNDGTRREFSVADIFLAASLQRVAG